MQKDILAATVSTTTTMAEGFGPVVFFMNSVLVLNATPPALRILPVPVQAAFLHITIQVGLVLGCGKCPAICCVVDTAAALTTGNFHFYY
jgi:hypothetical protein